ncbi:uncharacterized protein G6M90_00g018160 [Metarhizium brunneum]|uniref:ubiquitinyl hydrolase 1 n=1 Tax=Metarhizium brunneum TaxID=500148 RepID=A0A7D5YZB8_9HYPO|nr:hypothetical protein G6M90_00g018160 [Metarhizium brunneum]
MDDAAAKHWYVQVENSEKESFIQKAAEVALICVATFDVGEECLLELLSAEENVAIFIECSIMIRENIHTVDPEDQLHAIWFLTWKRITYTGIEALLNTITTTKCLDTAIGHCRNTGTLHDPQPWLVTEFHWVFTKRRIPGSTEHRRDYFNVLTAEFLVNGLPSGKLPRDIEEHEAYSTFFGHARLDVNECSEKGMQYQTVHKIHGHDVSLGLLATPESFQESLGCEENPDFIIAATADSGCQYDLVPGRLFHKALPNEFFEKHVHWLFRKGRNMVIEFRPKHLPWKHEGTNWVLHKVGDYWQLAEPSGGLLVDTAREASKQVTDAFASLAEPEDIHIVYFPRTKHLEVHLPRLQLEFYIEEKSSRILSRQYQGMWVDSCQDIDTLIGLHQKLVLRDERSHRLLLIPEGELNLATPEMNDTHVFVTIDVPSCGKVYAYELDTYLGKLCGRDFESILRLALLHGYTSGCVPDPFTGYTGTERALQIVRSAEINSPRAVSPERAKGELLLQASWQEFQPQILRRRNEAKKEFEDHLLGIKKALLRGSLPQNSLTELNTAAIQPNLPRVCTHFLVEQLASNDQLPLQWKRELAIFATRLSKWQNWDRLLLLPGTAHKDALKQLHGLKPRTWDPMMHPEWLVFEVENNISIRDIQIEFANAMMNPPNRHNSIMQLNMGEGKSSVIVPIIATSLCRKGNLVRLIVTRSQFAQMSQIMTARLGGLLGRRIYHLPISRNMTLTEASVGKLHKIIQDCVESKGILIVQPEQILSLNLMISDYSSKCSEKAREVLYDIKHLLDDSCRDIVDESDDVFSPRYELVYPLGKEQPIDFARERCSIISQILTIACKKAEAIVEEMPGGLVISPVGPGRYPKLSLVTREASELLERRIAEEICLTGLIGFSISQTSSFSTYKEKILEFWTNRALKETTREFIEKDLCWAPQMTSFLYLIRGLIACGVLSAALRDRFRVNYGLDKTRMPKTDLAVPYRAKDTPSVGSEYSQPDTVITKTYLAYYYDGLNDRDLTETLMHLLQSDRSHIEYQEWVKAAPDLPKAWHDVKGINLEDTQLCKRDLFPRLRSLRVCIDYYLSYIVFPKQLREYSEKISASGWDIGRSKELVTTGFSGTHDLKPLLPLTMRQQDLISQAHTDALVLEKMLGLHNHTHFLDPPNSSRISEDFLQKITTQEPDIRVIIDVGAYLIDLTNEQVARTWLGILQGRNLMIDAAIYCDDNGDLTVLDRHGKTESLQLSPFARQMERCVVFLDEAHSRGTDLKLPSTSCMRMRLLGDGQSVIYCVPNDIQSQIKASANRSTKQPPSIEDIIYWSIEQTAIETGQLLPIWAKQGGQYVQQSKTWAQIRESPDMSLRRASANAFKETGIRTIKSLYQPQNSFNIPTDDDNEMAVLIHERLKEFQHLGAVDNGCSEEREQQRETEQEQQHELEAQVTEQRHLHRSRICSVATHEVHADVEAFVKFGTLRDHGVGIIGAFTSLSDTTAALQFDLRNFPSQLKVSRDFANVVRETAGTSQEHCDLFKRPIHHILTTAGEKGMITNMLIISPYEAESLYKMIEKSKTTKLHIYAARQNSSYMPVDDLDLYTIPTSPIKRQVPLHLKIELNLFAGQLYFASFKEYTDVCTYLGIAWNDTFTNTDSDGFIIRGKGGDEVPDCLNLAASPIPFLKSFITNVRHYGNNISKTHVGKMLNGEFLTESDFPKRQKRKRNEEAEKDGLRSVKREKVNEDQGSMFVKQEEDVEMEG